LERNLRAKDRLVEFKEKLDLFKDILAQKQKSKKKYYSIHEQEVECISKGKEHKKYEFGNKVSIIRTLGGLIIGAKSFRNEYDGHTIDDSLIQVEKLTGKDPRYSLVSLVTGGKKSQRRHKFLKKMHNLFCQRTGIEPTIGHLKSDHRLGRNFYKGLFGDAINVMLAAIAYNFKRAMRTLFFLFVFTRKLIPQILSTNQIAYAN
jgi:transposase, IS5 family